MCLLFAVLWYNIPKMVIVILKFIDIRGVRKMENQKYCKHCGEVIDADCIICPKCGKQVETLEQKQGVVINNTVSATAVAGGGMNEESPKSKILALILAIFLGAAGIHRFYVGKIGTGIIWLCTGGCFAIGWIYDIIKIASGTFRDGAQRIIK